MRRSKEVTIKQMAPFEGAFSCTLLSSMTVLRDSIHMGSMSPSSTIHFELSLVMLAKSRMIVEKRPGNPCENCHMLCRQTILLLPSPSTKNHNPKYMPTFNITLTHQVCT